ncbi:alpha/beta-hydrolase [Paramyrothecium foliicola]|nr:alpha/beta-hydrolase [Paramyrothecium foliicola]
MASNPLTLLTGLVAFFSYYAAACLGLLQESLSHGSVKHGFDLPTSLHSPPVVIDVKRDIKYVGSKLLDVEHFQNIFYAEDTAGRNRFKPPVPSNPAKGSVIDARQPGAWCPQGKGDVLPFTSLVLNISENCLSLRVARPADTKANAKLPVMVWLHGGKAPDHLEFSGTVANALDQYTGGHALGSGSDILYTPDGLVKQALSRQQPVIWVAINYRLGFFGFATNEAIVKANHANMGLRIRDNIEYFGGDPRRVTAIGQSVGASDISLQMTAFGGNHGAPFQRAILMSGAPGLNFNTKSELVKDNTIAVAESVGCIRGDGQSIDTLNCLRRVPFEILTNISVTASRNARPPFGEGFFFPTYDGDFIQDRPSELVRAGKIAKGIPIIASWVTNDGAWYPSPATATDEQVLASFGLWLQGLSKSTKKKLLKLYPVKDFEGMVRPDYDGPISSQYYRAAQLNRDLWFTCPVLDFAWQYVRTGGIDVSQARIYEHNSTRYTPVFKAMGVPMWRVAHLSDIPYVLNSQHLTGGADNSMEQLKLSAEISHELVEFVAIANGKKGFDNKWPAAFKHATKEELRRTAFPKSFILQLFGGPYGNTPVMVRRAPSHEGPYDAERAIQWERLIERCEFINSNIDQQPAMARFGISLLLVGIATLMAYATASFIANRRHIRKLQAAGVPMPKYHPILGHLLAVKECKGMLPLDATFHIVARFLSKQFPDGIFYLTLWPFSKTIMIVADPFVAAQVESASTEKPRSICSTLEVINGGPSLMTMHGGQWKEWRALFNPGFAIGYLTGLAPAIAEEVEVFCKLLSDRAEKGEIFRLEEHTLRLTFDIIGRVTFGGRLHYQTQKSALADCLRRQIIWSPFVKSLNPIKRYVTIRPLVQMYNSYRMNQYLDREIDQRYEELIHSPMKKALEVTSEASSLSKEAFRRLARPQLRMFLFAGHDTTSSTLLYCYMLLDKYPEAMSKVREEHDKVFGAAVSINNISQVIESNPALLNQIPYTLAVIKEVLRMFPPAGSLREGRPDLILRDEQGRQYPTEHCHIWTLTLIMHNDPKVFSDPGSFNPDRWLVGPGDPLHPQKGSWRPFEWGPRNCIGQTLAQLELKIALVMTVRLFDIKPAYEQWDMLHPKKGIKVVEGNRVYQAELGGGGAHPADGFPVTVTRRQ